MDESKQNRKTPLTTVSISQEMASKLDELLKNKYPGMKRKEFLEAAVLYFERTGYDLSSDMMDFSSLERLTDRLEKSAAIIDEENQGREQIKQFFLEIKQKQLALPSSADITAANEAKATAESELTLANQKLEVAQAKITDLLQEITFLKSERQKDQEALWKEIDWHKEQLKDQKNETATLRQEMESLNYMLESTEKTLGRRTTLLLKANEEFKRLSKGLFNKPNQDILKELQDI